MRKILFLLALPLAFTAFVIHSNTELTEADRKFAADHLNKTRAELVAAVQGLSEAQLNYKTAPDRWPVLECVQHITLTSKFKWANATDAEDNQRQCLEVNYYG